MIATNEYRPRIAIVDDDADMRSTLTELLGENGFDAVALASSQEFYDLGDEPAVDLALIDLKLKGESGLTLAINIRKVSDLPIVMLTGVGDVVDKIVGLEVGSDDYLMKPFNPRELIARLRAVLRRYGVTQVPRTTSPKPDTASTLHFGSNVLDQEQRALFDADGVEIALTNAEYRLLEYFLRHPNRIIPRTELLAELGSDLSHYVDRTIDVLILRLRRKIEKSPSKPMHLQTRRGQGYIFVTNAGDAP
uniref:Two-component response regulator n=1 Tax=endosymbiont of Ridgeia piscesae TaxID=54398 RepID=D2CL03_9GAMM|nr:two-component response regulator [endosymbiont of Ridgeia piscesae]